MPFCFPSGQLFEVHGNKLKPHPFGDLGQTSVKRITHEQLSLGPLVPVQQAGDGVRQPDGGGKAAVGQQGVQLDQQPAKLVHADAPRHIQRRQDGLAANGEQLGQAGLAQGAQLHRTLFHVGGGLLQGFDHGLRGTGRLSQQGGRLAAGLVCLERDAPDLLDRLFDCLHKICSFTCFLLKNRLQ